MATTIINISGGNVALDSLRVSLKAGDRRVFECTESELLTLCPDLHLLRSRNRIVIAEDAVVVEEPTPTPAVEQDTEIKVEATQAQEPKVVKSPKKAVKAE